MAAPYDVVYQIMYSAMMRLNDTIESLQALGGVILENPQAFSQQAVNNAYRRTQDGLRALGYQSLTNEKDYIDLPACPSTDPLVQTYLNWSGFYNGAVLNTNFVLPSDFISPLELWERISGTNSNMLEMDEMINGLPSVSKLQWNRTWQWRDEAIYFPGASVPFDLRVRYAKTNPDFADNTPLASTPWFLQVVPINNILDSFAWAICYEFAVARMQSAEDSALAMAFKANADDALQMVFGRDVRRPTSIYKASEYSKMRDRWTPPVPMLKPPQA